MAEAVLGLGGNLGARRAIFRAAIALLDAQPGLRVLARSALYATPPLGPPQPDYLNAALRLSCECEVQQLLTIAQRIEALLGRERRVRWGPRTLDVDVLHWSEGPVRSERLEVPHRELGKRAFALAPLLDVAPELEAEFSAALVGLGGRPPQAQPGWPELTREGAFVCGGWLSEDTEIASQWIELLASSEGLAERADRARAGHAKLVTHAFTGPRELFDADGRSWLTAVVADAAGRGFAVQMGAVLACDEASASGVLLGYDGVPPATLGSSSVQLERRGEREQRVKMPLPTPERGHDFNGSGTM